MEAVHYVKLRASGLGILIGLCALWGAVVGVFFALSTRDWGSVAALALWAAFVALLSDTFLGRWALKAFSAPKGMAGFFAAIMLLVLLVGPFFVLVWPPRKLALSKGWIVPAGA